MPIALRMNKTSLQTTNNVTSQLINNMTYQINNPQENIQKLQQLIYNWKNNQPLVMLSFCLFIIILCTVLSWYFDTYLPRKRNSNEILVDEEIENNESLENKAFSKSFKVTIASSSTE